MSDMGLTDADQISETPFQYVINLKVPRLSAALLMLRGKQKGGLHTACQDQARQASTGQKRRHLERCTPFRWLRPELAREIVPTRNGLYKRVL
jgi:hypothetical protein